MLQRLKFESDFIRSPENKYGKYDFKFHGLKDEKDLLIYKDIKPGIFFTCFSAPKGLISGFDFEVENNPIEFTFCVKGKSKVIFKNSKNSQKKEFYSKSGMNIISSISSAYGEFDINKSDHFKTVGLHVDPILLLSYLEPYMDNLAKEVRGLVENHDKGFHLPLYMNPQMEKTAWDIINSPYHGITSDLYLESKALELLAMQIESLINFEKVKKIPFITVDDIHKVYEARNILVKNIENPPTINKLSRLAGINEFKLKKGFKEIFGTTIFGYLKKERMDTAKNLILEGTENVSEIAYCVGYSNVSHFITAYKKEFGITPGEYIKKRYCNVA